MLDKKESMYWNSIKAKSGVVYLKGEPGIAKSAILRGIADKVGLQYIDLRLSQMDETDVGLYPTIENKNGIKFVEHVPPEWAVISNEKPTLIHFEELNRAQLNVRNAALQILLERRIGYKFGFNEQVYMVASGNLGSEDKTEVEEFDSALNGRLIHFRHSLLLSEWIEGYAKTNVNQYIISFLKAYPEHYYKTSDNSGAYATPRSWTFFSDFLRNNEITDIQNIMIHAREVGVNYVGPSITKFIRYLEDASQVNVEDILIRFDEVKDVVSAFPRPRISELLNSLKEVKVETMNDKAIKNVKSFCKVLLEDELASYVIHVLDNENERNETVKSFLKSYKNILDKIMAIK